MTQGIQLETRSGGRAQGAGLSAWWWLGLPLGLAVALVFAAVAAPEFYSDWVDRETGLIESGQILVLLASLVLALRLLPSAELGGRPWLRLWVGLAALGCLYVAGEEASWGQHYLEWATPESWREINDQQETNLHNVSSWFDQKPRLLMELGVIVGGILIPLLALWRPGIRRGPPAIILPPLLCLPTALLAEISRVGERLAGLVGGETHFFPRASEVQELYFYLFILLYLMVLRRRVLAG